MIISPASFSTAGLLNRGILIVILVCVLFERMLVVVRVLCCVAKRKKPRLLAGHSTVLEYVVCSIPAVIIIKYF